VIFLRTGRVPAKGVDAAKTFGRQRAGGSAPGAARPLRDTLARRYRPICVARWMLTGRVAFRSNALRFLQPQA
jgi:hypothetical protein